MLADPAAQAVRPPDPPAYGTAVWVVPIPAPCRDMALPDRWRLSL
jgi:hypothetical protein